jgi:hypothetical protein
MSYRNSNFLMFIFQCRFFFSRQKIIVPEGLVDFALPSFSRAKQKEEKPLRSLRLERSGR